jgi:hypothetical protein
MKTRDLIWILSAIVTILLVLNVFAGKLVPNGYLKKNKEEIGVIKDITTIAAIIIALIFSYYKFFVGKTYSSKANTDIAYTLIETPFESIFHNIKISFINTGEIAIWEPKLTVQAKLMENEKDKFNIEVFSDITEISLESTADDTGYLVGPSETAYFLFQKHVPKKVWAVNYLISIRESRGIKWTNTVIIENKIAKKEA